MSHEMCEVNLSKVWYRIEDRMQQILSLCHHGDLTQKKKYKLYIRQ